MMLLHDITEFFFHISYFKEILSTSTLIDSSYERELAIIQSSLFSFTFLGPFFGFGHHCFFVFFVSASVLFGVDVDVGFRGAQVLQLMLSEGDRVTLRATPLDHTSIRTGGRRREPNKSRLARRAHHRLLHAAGHGRRAQVHTTPRLFLDFALFLRFFFLILPQQTPLCFPLFSH